MSDFVKLADQVTANGDSKVFSDVEGKYSLGFFGSFGAATVKFIFHTRDANGDLVELAESSDWTFSGTMPGPEKFVFPEAMPFLIRTSGADGATDFSINAHYVKD